MDSMNCEACQTELIATSVEAEQVVRCASCGHRFLPKLSDTEATRKTDRMAKRSFWLGISSVLLFALTGIPALIYGVRSLRRMRFRVANKREKFQAITGTVLGILFGCLGSLFLMLVGVVILMVVFTFEQSLDPVRIDEVAQTVMIYDPIDGVELVPQRLFALIGQKSFSYVDTQERADQSIILRFIELHMQPGATQAKSLSQKISGNPAEYSRASSEEFSNWKVAGNGLAIRRTYEHKDDSGTKLVAYSFYAQNEMSWLVVSLTLKKPQSSVTEAQVREFFESIKPAILAE